MKYRVLNTIFILVLIATAVYAGWNVRNDAVVKAQPEIQYVEVPVEVPQLYIKTVQVPVETIVEKVIEKPVYPALTDFKTVAELEAFLEKDDTNTTVRIRLHPDGTTPFWGQCEEYALTLVENAEKTGKRLHFAAITQDEKTAHAICLAIIGNDIYYIEPQDDVVWKSKFILDPVE